MARIMTVAQLDELRAAGENVPTPFMQRVAHTLSPGEIATAIRRLLVLRGLLDATETEGSTFTAVERRAWFVAHEAERAPGGPAARMLADGARVQEGREGQYANLVGVLVDDVLPPAWRENLKVHAARLEAEGRGEAPPGSACAATIAALQYLHAQ